MVNVTTIIKMSLQTLLLFALLYCGNSSLAVAAPPPATTPAKNVTQPTAKKQTKQKKQKKSSKKHQKHHAKLKPTIREPGEEILPPQTESMSFLNTVQKNIIQAVNQTVSRLRYSAYKLGGSHFDVEKGVYIVDCSNFVDHILRAATPHAYYSLVNAAGTDMPATSHYYDFFSELSDSPNEYWNKVDAIEKLRPGDILVFRYKNSHGNQTGGHIMLVMDKPVRDTDVFFVRVADSAASGHSEDTRENHTSGIGIGTMLLKMNPKTGQPAAYAWGVNGYWKRNVTIAMARPVEFS